MALGPSPAHSQDTVLVECDKVAGTASVKPPLSSVAVANTAIITKGPLVGTGDPLTQFKPVATTINCEGLLATPGDGGTPDDVGNLTKMAGKFIGSATCNLLADPPITDPLDPLDGKITATYSELDPNDKPWSQQMWVRLGGGTDPLLPDEIKIANGIVIKGPGSGADVSGSFMFGPYDAKTKMLDWPDPAPPAPPIPPTPKPALRPNQSQLGTDGTLIPGSGSSAIGAECLIGLNTISTVFFSTDGTGLLGGILDSSIVVSLPEPT
jgi:hypothetical protein